MCGAEASEDVLTVADDIQVGDVYQQSIQNADDVFGEDIQVCLAGEQKGLDDLERAMDITGGTEILGQNRFSSRAMGNKDIFDAKGFKSSMHLRETFLAVVAGNSALNEVADLSQLCRLGCGIEDQIGELAGLGAFLFRTRRVAVVDERGMLDVPGGDEGRMRSIGRGHRWGQSISRESVGTRVRDRTSTRTGASAGRGRGRDRRGG